MRETNRNGYQVISDSQRVWVNGRNGESLARLGRFGKIVMIDIHHGLDVQRASGNECLDCRHDLVGTEAWRYFVESVHRNFGISITDAHRPSWAHSPVLL